MFKKTLLALTLMSSALSASAAVQAYDWSFQGFIYVERDQPGVFSPTRQIHGRFLVDDKNADGTFGVDEVLSFLHDGRDYSKLGSTGVQAFSFTPGGTLDFTVAAAWSDSTINYGMSIVTGDSVGYGWHDPVWGGQGSEYWLWSDRTRLTVTAVPEPQTWLMLGAGLLLTAGATRRRRKQASQ